MATRVAGPAATPARPRMRRALAAAFAAAFAAATAAAVGCGGSSTQAEAARTLRSWDATLDLLEQAEAEGAVPGRFGRQVREAADQERARAREKLHPSRERSP